MHNKLLYRYEERLQLGDYVMVFANPDREKTFVNHWNDEGDAEGVVEDENLEGGVFDKKNSGEGGSDKPDENREEKKSKENSSGDNKEDYEYYDDEQWEAEYQRELEKLFPKLGVSRVPIDQSYYKKNVITLPRAEKIFDLIFKFNIDFPDKKAFMTVLRAAFLKAYNGLEDWIDYEQLEKERKAKEHAAKIGDANFDVAGDGKAKIKWVEPFDASCDKDNGDNEENQDRLNRKIVWGGGLYKFSDEMARWECNPHSWQQKLQQQGMLADEIERQRQEIFAEEKLAMEEEGNMDPVFIDDKMSKMSQISTPKGSLGDFDKINKLASKKQSSESLKNIKPALVDKNKDPSMTPQKKVGFGGESFCKEDEVRSNANDNYFSDTDEVWANEIENGMYDMVYDEKPFKLPTHEGNPPNARVRDFMTLLRKTVYVCMASQGIILREFISKCKNYILVVMYCPELNCKKIAEAMGQQKMLDLAMCDLLSLEPIDSKNRPYRTNMCLYSKAKWESVYSVRDGLPYEGLGRNIRDLIMNEIKYKQIIRRIKSQWDRNDEILEYEQNIMEHQKVSRAEWQSYLQYLTKLAPMVKNIEEFYQSELKRINYEVRNNKVWIVRNGRLKRRIDKSLQVKLCAHSYKNAFLSALNESNIEANKSNSFARLTNIWTPLGFKPFEFSIPFFNPTNRQRVRNREYNSIIWKTHLINEKGDTSYFSQMERMKIIQWLVTQIFDLGSLGWWQMKYFECGQKHDDDILEPLKDVMFPIHDRFKLEETAMWKIFLPQLAWKKNYRYNPGTTVEGKVKIFDPSLKKGNKKTMRDGTEKDGTVARNWLPSLPPILETDELDDNYKTDPPPNPDVKELQSKNMEPPAPEFLGGDDNQGKLNDLKGEQTKQLGDKDNKAKPLDTDDLVIKVKGDDQNKPKDSKSSIKKVNQAEIDEDEEDDEEFPSMFTKRQPKKIKTNTEAENMMKALARESSHGKSNKTRATLNKRDARQLRMLNKALAIQKLSEPKWPLSRHFRLHFSRPWKMPMRAVREYFGEKITLYFAFLSFFIKFLLPMGILGIPIYVVGFVNRNTPQNVLIHRIWQLSSWLFGIAITLWVSFFMSKWSYQEHKFVMKFGMADDDDQAELQKVKRIEFEGTYYRCISTDDMNDQEANSSAQNCKSFVTVFLLIIFLGINFGVCYGVGTQKQLFYDNRYLPDVPLVNLNQLIWNFVLYCYINISNKVWFNLAVQLVSWQDPKFKEEFEIKLINFTCTFSIQNVGCPIFYILYVNYRLPYGCIGQNNVHYAGRESQACYDEATFFVAIYQFCCLIGHFVKYLSNNFVAAARKLKRDSEIRDLELSHKKKEMQSDLNSNVSEGDKMRDDIKNDDPTSRRINIKIRENIEKMKHFNWTEEEAYHYINREIEGQLKLSSYNEADDYDGSVKEYQEVVIQISIIVLFGVQFPLAYIVSYFSQLLNLLNDRKSLLLFSRRPDPSSASNIGNFIF